MRIYILQVIFEWTIQIDRLRTNLNRTVYEYKCCTYLRVFKIKKKKNVYILIFYILTSFKEVWYGLVYCISRFINCNLVYNVKQLNSKQKYYVWHFQFYSIFELSNSFITTITKDIHFTHKTLLNIISYRH